jgi:Lrp/AsnC family transcriptional regulator, leucine-responsive regulatory protein
MDVMQAKIDDTDWRILAELQLDGRLSYKELGRRIHLSAPAVAERVRRLEDAGVIVGYGAQVDASHAGLPLLAFLQLRCRPDDCLLRTSTADDYPEIIAVHKLAGEFCSMLTVRASTLSHFEGLAERLGSHGDMRTHIVMSTQYAGRPVQPIANDRPVTQADGWTTP